MMLIGDMIRREARIRGRKLAVVDGEKEFTYQEVNQRANRLANALLKIGVVKGEKIAFMGNTSHQFMEFYFAAAKIGSVAVPINARFSSDEAAYVLKKAEVKLLIYAEDMEETVQKLRPAVPGINQYISTGNTL